MKPKQGKVIKHDHNKMFGTVYFDVYDRKLIMRLFKELSTHSYMRYRFNKGNFTYATVTFSTNEYKRKHIDVYNLLEENC